MTHDEMNVLRQARDDLADIGRHHTRAIHALAGRVEYPPDERADTGRRLTAALARIDAALAASSSQERRRGMPDQSSTLDAREMQRVAGRCPSCGRETLFLGAGGYVTCSLLGCEDPNRAQRMLEQLSEES